MYRSKTKLQHRNSLVITRDSNRSKEEPRPSGDSFDLFLAGSFESCLKKNLDAEKFRKIENLLLDTFGISSITDCMSDDSGKVCLLAAMRDALGPVSSIKVMQNTAKKLFSVSKDRKHAVILLHDRNLCEKIMFSYGDRQKKKILDLLRDKSMMLVHMPDRIGISQGTCYRRARELIDDGLLVIARYDDENKETRNAYTCMFSDFGISFAPQSDGNNNDIINKVQVAVKKEFLESCLLCYVHPSGKFPKNIRLVFDTHKAKKQFTNSQKQDMVK